MIEIEINTRDLNSALELLESKLANRRSLMADLARILNNAVDDNFAAGGRPSWAPLKYPRRRGGGKPLQDTGRLRSSMVSQSDNNQAVVGTNVQYAAIHHYGGKTPAHIIRPKSGKALKFGSRFAKKVNHPGSNIPARPFMVLQPEDEKALTEAVSDYLGVGRF